MFKFLTVSCMEYTVALRARQFSEASFALLQPGWFSPRYFAPTQYSFFLFFLSFSYFPFFFFYFSLSSFLFFFFSFSFSCFFFLYYFFFLFFFFLSSSFFLSSPLSFFLSLSFLSFSKPVTPTLPESPSFLALSFFIP